MSHNYMQLLMKKLSISILTSVFVLGGLLGAFGAQAAEHPTLSKIKDVSRTSVVLPVTFKDLKKKDVVIRVRVRNAETGKVEIRKFNAELGKKGKEKVTISNLMPDTKYKFSVKIRKITIDRFSDSSQTRSAITLP